MISIKEHCFYGVQGIGKIRRLCGFVITTKQIEYNLMLI